MNVWVNNDGTRDRRLRPYIEQEEQGNTVYPYDPNGRGFNYGLYQGGQPTCESWVQLFNQFPAKDTPVRTIQKIERSYPLRRK